MVTSPSMNLSYYQEQRKLPKNNTLISFDEEGSQSILEIRDSISGSEILGQEVLFTFLHLRQVCSSVLDLVFLLQAL